MSRELVEQQRYNLPETDYSDSNETLSSSFNRRRLIKPTHWQNYSNLHDLAQNLALKKTPDLNTPKAIWRMYRKGNLTVPNFASPDTRASVELALYEVPDLRFESIDSSTPYKATNALLRLSPDYQPQSKFRDDVAALSKYYIERPLVRGIPNKLHDLPQYLIAGLALGIGSGLLSDYATGRTMSEGVFIGNIAGPTIAALTYALIEKYASSHISNLGDYRANAAASSALHQIDQHITKVSIQRELYSSLADVHIDRSAEEFLADIWPQIPSSLIEKREEEIKQAKGKGTYFNQVPVDAIDRMVQVTKLLQAA